MHVKLHEKLVSSLPRAGKWLVLARFGSAAFTFFTTAILAHWLESSELSEYFLITNLVFVFATICQLGLNSAVIKYVPQVSVVDEALKAKGIMTQSLTLVAMFGIMLAATFFFLGPSLIEAALGMKIDTVAVVFVAIWLFVRAVQILIAECYRVIGVPDLAAVFGGLTYAATGLLASSLNVAFSTQLDVNDIIVTWSLMSLFVLLLSAIILYRKATKVFGSGALEFMNIGQLAQTCFPMWVTSALVLLVSRTDIWMVGFTGSSAHIAVFGVATQLILLLTIPSTIVNGILSPVISSYIAQGDKTRLEKLVRSMSTLSALLTILPYLGFMVFGVAFLKLLFGCEFVYSHVIFLMLGVGQIAVSVAGPSGHIMNLGGQEKNLSRIMFLSAGISILGAFTAGSAFGAIGVAGAYSLGLVFQGLLTAIFAKKLVGVRTYVFFLSKKSKTD